MSVLEADTALDVNATTRARRILHVLSGSDFGGGSRIVLDLAVAAQVAGYSVSVITTDERLRSLMQDHDIDVVDGIDIPRRLSPVADLRALVRLRSFLRHNPQDVVHTHTSKGGLVGRVAARLAGVPVVIHTVHGFAFHEGTSRQARWMHVWLERLLGLITTRLVTVSEHHREVASDSGTAAAAKVVAIPNGIPDPPHPHPGTHAEPGSGTFALVCHGRLATQKGITYLLQAIAALSDAQRQACHLGVLGEGELAADLEAEASALGIGDQVRFHGFRSDVHGVVGLADLVVLPSLWEGLSISLLEAMALSRPIITTAIPSNTEVVADSACAVLVPPADPGALAREISRLMADPEEREALGRRARERYLQVYGVQRMQEGYLELYTSLIGSPVIV